MPASPRFGIFVPQTWNSQLAQTTDPVAHWERMTEVARTADAGTWDSIWLYDHLFSAPPDSDSTFECWTTTAAMARDTQRVNIGQMTSSNGFRNPALFAKMASTVDVASHGRLYAGLGAGWDPYEWKAYGYEWRPLKDRMGSFQEATEIIYRMFTEDEPVFTGRYHSIDKPINEPKGVRKPHPSFWIGGGGPAITLKLVARFGDAANIGWNDPAEIKEKTAILRGHCDDVGRDYAEIIKSTGIHAYPIDAGDDPERATAKVRGGADWATFSARHVIATEDQIADRLAELIDAGADYVICYVPGVADDVSLVQRMDKITQRIT